jgi:6-phosphofructokinase 1
MKLRRIGVLTSGGDAPGINACIRAVVRIAVDHGVEVIGILEGFDGLIRGEMKELRARDVGGILGQGGTFLRTARCPAFLELKGQRKALRELNETEIEGMIVIGGDGSMRGAHALAGLNFPVVGVPSSIDNDVWGTDMSIGVDTALNTIMNAVDKLRDTATSHERVFLVETMGRECGYLALNVGVVCGAEVILVPEMEMTLEQVAEAIESAYARGKSHAIIIVSEGASLKVGAIADYLDAHEVGFETRVTILGHVSRGGSPSAFDRMLGTRMGTEAVNALLAGKTDVMVGLDDQGIVLVPLEQVSARSREPNVDFYSMAKILAR